MSNQHGSTGHAELDKAIELAGYLYDPEQDIFYSNINPWQRSVGYCRLYDEAAAPLGMIIDCEPIYFNYRGTKWMVGLWKGQYDMVSGGEIGIYTQGLDLDLPGLFKGTFYNAASNNDLLEMSFALRKNGQVLFTREGKHWWLTGFKLGEFSEPSELAMDLNITFIDETMRDAFIAGLKNAGYSDNKFSFVQNTVSLIFDVPCSSQPITRSKEIDGVIQRKNKELCHLYQELTGDYDHFPDKITALETESPALYRKILKMGKSKHAYELFSSLILITTVLLSFSSYSRS